MWQKQEPPALRVSWGYPQGGSRALLSSSPAELVKTGFDLNEL